MKKNTFLVLAVLCLTTYQAIAQRANLDRESFKTAYVVLPSEPILDDAKRTFSSNMNALGISGYSRVADGGTINVEFRFHGTDVGEVDIRKEKVEKKDKDGNITDTYYLHRAVIGYSSKATLSVHNGETGKPWSRSYSENTVHETKTFRSSYEASKYYNNNRHNIRDRYRTDHRNQFINQARSLLNNTYGYVPYESSNGSIFWIIATKKHPEYAKHQEAYAALKEIFSQVASDKPIADIIPSLEPWIKYFNEVVAKYNEDDKKHRKVRYASYYNNAQIYLQTEQFEKAKEYANKLIENDYDKKDGKRFITNADKILAKLKLNELDSRHFEVVTEDLTNLPDEPQVVYAEATEEAEKTVAFIITKENDTIQNTIDLNKVGEMSEVAAVFDEESKPQELLASASNKIVLATGDTYKSLAFVSSVAPKSGAGEKFAKQIHEGAKVNLYQHMEKEYVLEFVETGKIISVMSKDFVFGFDKKLSSFCENCEALKNRVLAKEFKNTEEGLTAFCTAFNACE